MVTRKKHGATSAARSKSARKSPPPSEAATLRQLGAMLVALDAQRAAIKRKLRELRDAREARAAKKQLALPGVVTVSPVPPAEPTTPVTKRDKRTRRLEQTATVRVERAPGVWVKRRGAK